jgi:hypothetical protein
MLWSLNFVCIERHGRTRGGNSETAKREFLEQILVRQILGLIYFLHKPEHKRTRKENGYLFQSADATSQKSKTRLNLTFWVTISLSHSKLIPKWSPTVDHHQFFPKPSRHDDNCCIFILCRVFIVCVFCVFVWSLCYFVWCVLFVCCVLL